jgi:hypothetical protein
MDLEKVLTQLREELANLDAAILSLERLQQVSGARRRSRPPGVLSGVAKAASGGPQRHTGGAPGEDA